MAVELGIVNTWNLNHSYLIGYNDSAGWGPGHYFTFFSQFQRPSRNLPIFEAVILMAIYLVAIIGNVLVLVIMFQGRKKPTGNNLCVANLAVSALVTSACMPLVAVTRGTDIWIFGRAPCGLVVYTMYCGALITVWTMALISFDRYHCTQTRSPLKPKKILVIILIMWSVALPASVPIGYYFVIRTFTIGNEEVQICTLVWPYNEHVRVSVLVMLPSVTFFFILPIIIIICNYVRLMKVLKQSTQKLHHGNISMQIESTPRVNIFNSRNFRNRRDMRLARLLILHVVIFFVMWLPISVCFFLLIYDALSNVLVLTSQAFLASMCIGISNTWVNPIVFTFVNENCKEWLKRNLTAVCPCILLKNKIHNGGLNTIDEQTRHNMM